MTFDYQSRERDTLALPFSRVSISLRNEKGAGIVVRVAVEAKLSGHSTSSINVGLRYRT